jgi:DNA topoisomerase IB
MPTTHAAAPAKAPVARPVPVAAVPVPPAEPADAARAVGLRYVSDADPGLRREQAGRGFRYRDAAGAVVRDADVLARIRSLAIPPAWTSVWICADPRGHLQATGRDARGRKQYRYHPRWHAVRGDGKFSRLVAFGQQLPRLRRRLRRDLARRGLPREKVLAVAVSLLAGTLVRVGNEEYARTNRSYGLTTLRERHVAFLRKGRALLRFRGKSGQPHEVRVDDARLTRVLRRCTQLPGQSLFQYLDDDGTRQSIDSGMVNEYLHEAMGEDFTAKDFRTWGGTVQAIACLARTPLPEEASEREQAGAITAVVREVASVLRNTPAVCRGSYIHPDVFDAWRDGSLHRLVPPARASHPRQLETATLRLLRRAQRRRARPASRRTRKAKQ